MTITLWKAHEVEVSGGATHYGGDLFDEPGFYKCTQVGVAGDHWWVWTQNKGWMLAGHNKPHWTKPLPLDGTVIR